VRIKESTRTLNVEFTEKIRVERTSEEIEIVRSWVRIFVASQSSSLSWAFNNLKCQLFSLDDDLLGSYGSSKLNRTLFQRKQFVYSSIWKINFQDIFIRKYWNCNCYDAKL